jgi:hypothetical protein
VLAGTQDQSRAAAQRRPARLSGLRMFAHAQHRPLLCVVAVSVVTCPRVYVAFALLPYLNTDPDRTSSHPGHDLLCQLQAPKSRESYGSFPPGIDIRAVASASAFSASTVACVVSPGGSLWRPRVDVRHLRSLIATAVSFAQCLYVQVECFAYVGHGPRGMSGELSPAQVWARRHRPTH